MGYEDLKRHIDEVFPRLWKRVNPEKITTVLLIQVKGGDVHPDNRDPGMGGKKTQIDLTGSAKTDSKLSPVTGLFTPTGDTGIYQPVTIFHPIEEQWVETALKLNSQVTDHKPPSRGQSRALLGGREPHSWSSELWANMGHYISDKYGFILFIREGWAPPVSFNLPNHPLLERMLQEYGASKGRNTSRKRRFIYDSPRSKAAIILGPGLQSTSNELEYLYVVTKPNSEGWVKVGKTKRRPIERLMGYDQGPDYYDMNYVAATSDCDNAEREMLRRIRLLGFETAGKEWFKMGGIDVAVSVIQTVAKLYPTQVYVEIDPIVRSTESWAYP